MAQDKRTSLSIQANLFAGILTVIPLVVVWIVFDFLLTALYAAGSPLADAFAAFIENRVPELTPILVNEYVRWTISVMVALLVLYTIGAAASRVVGRRLISYFEQIIDRIPFVQTLYSATKKLIAALQQKPTGAERVVLVEFPHPGMKTIGLVMQTFADSKTGEELAAIYVPTTPNPTSGYLEIVPVAALTSTDFTIDQAMTMVISGGAITPGPLTLRRNDQKP